MSRCPSMALPSAQLQSHSFLLFILFAAAAAASISSVETAAANYSNATISALIAFKESILHDPSNFMAAWNPYTNANFCTWPGILCNTNQDHVTSVLLQSLQLNGTLSPSLAELPYLKYINISNNGFHGEIPSQVFCSNSSQLSQLDIRNNSFTGYIPSSLANCTELVHLDLSHNSLYSTAQDSFPNFITSITSLTYLDLSSNYISGELPADLGQLSQLQFFQLNSANLTGSFPASLITNCTSLIWLDLSANDLSGQLPQLKWTPTLQGVKIHHNYNITGHIPTSIANCTSLSVLHLHYNSLTGPIPEGFSQLPLLQDLLIYQNYLTGPIPASIFSNCTKLINIQLGYNNLSGSIPATLGQLHELQSFAFSYNTMLQGSIPANIGLVSPKLILLAFSSTSVGGFLPHSLFNLTKLEYLRINSANFQGSLSPLFGNLTSLEHLRLGENAFSGSIPPQLGNLTSLIDLFLEGNSFVGSIPIELSSLKSLGALNLSNNFLTGQIPQQLSVCLSLTKLDLSLNTLLYGQIPSAFSELEWLSEINLAHCNLSGEIPNIFPRLIRLQILNLANNNLTGNIPWSLANLATLDQSLDLSFNSLSGTIPAALGNMNLLNALMLSSNKFTGQIPANLAGCQSLVTLDLSFNQLEGEISSELSQLKSLKSLNLSHNQLSGSLPYSLGSLTDLALLDVSYNNLQGPIPDDGIYMNQTSFLFSNNPGLCGFPTSTICSANNHKSRRIIISVAVTISVVILGLVLLKGLVFCWRRSQMSYKPFTGERSLTNNNISRADFDSDSDYLDCMEFRIKPWKAKDLRLITDGFDSSNIIGSGSMSVCYKGRISLLDDDNINYKKLGSAKQQYEFVAIKRLYTLAHGCLDANSRMSFVNELRTICKMRHRNLVKVLGYCVEGGEVALVMELMENGNLHEHLHPVGNTSIVCKMIWKQRLSVALDVAEGLVYMHHEYEQPIVHCDIKPMNILLESDMVAKISDFGIAKLIDRHDNIKNETKTDVTTSASKFRGTFGYAAPECASGSRISTQADVYSYGILLIELVTGMSPTNLVMQELGISLHTWARIHYQNGRTKDILDSTILKEEPRVLKEAMAVLEMGLKCSYQTAKDRPSNMKVVRDALLAVVHYNNNGHKLSSYPNIKELAQPPTNTF